MLQSSLTSRAGKMEGEFVVVSKKRGRKRKPRTSNVKQTYISTCSNSTSAFDESCYEKSLASIHKCRCEIESSSFWTDVKESWKKLRTASYLKTEEIVCYGAGSISSSPIARYQFAFLVLLAEHLELINHVHIYDPIFTSLERRIVLHFGFNLITKNEECRRSITKTTVVLMMHCGKKMYDNLLQANWSVGLQCMALIGNSFSSYQERFPSSLLKREAPYLYDIIPLSDEERIKNTFFHTDIFNDTSIMTFSSSKLSSVADDFWTRKRVRNGTECDTEIILKSKVDTFRP